MLSRGHQCFEQDIAVLVAAAGIAETALLFQQVKPGTFAAAGEIVGIQPQQHDGAMGNGPHRFESTDRQRPAAMAKPTGVDRERFVENAHHNSGIQLQGRGPCPLHPVIDRGMEPLQLAGPVIAIAKDLVQQLSKLLSPVLDAPGLSQALPPAGESIQHRPPAGQRVGGEILMERR